MHFLYLALHKIWLARFLVLLLACLPFNLSVCLSVCLPLSIWLSPTLSFSLPSTAQDLVARYLCFPLSPKLSLCPSVSLSVCLSACWSVCLSLSASGSLLHCPFLCLALTGCLLLGTSAPLCACQLSVNLSVCLYLPLALSVTLSVSLPSTAQDLAGSVPLLACLPASQSVCQSASQTVSVFVCLHTCLPVVSICHWLSLTESFSLPSSPQALCGSVPLPCRPVCPLLCVPLLIYLSGSLFHCQDSHSRGSPWLEHSL